MILNKCEMKKIITFSWVLLGTCLIYGQPVADYLLKAKALNEAGKPELAIKILNDALTDKREYRVYLQRAEANSLKGDYSAAIADLNEANKISPASGEYGLARIYGLKGDASTALYHLELNLKSEYKKPEKEVMLEPAFGTIENKQEWRQFWKKEWYSIPEKSISEIEYYISAGKTEESKEILSELKKNYENNSEIIYAESLINFGTGKYPEVIKVISVLNNESPGNEKYLRLLAKAQAAASDPAGASATYTELMDSGVEDAELLIMRAECYRKTGEADKAMTDIKRYLEIYPENRSALSLAGKVEARAGDNLQAIKYFSENLKIHPNDPECYVDRADAYFVSKSWNMAINDYSMSLDLKPGNSDVWLNKGISLLNTGKVEDACHDFKKSFSLGNKRVADYISKYCIK
jgi:tetratricopeptide (TPR) repeat protein